MAEVVTEKVVCDKCGVDVRDGTAYCYNCGASVTPFDPEKTLAMDLNGTETKEGEVPISQPSAAAARDDLSRAARRRKKARVLPRKTFEYTWEASDDTRLALIAAIVITILAATVVVMMVFLK